MTAPCRCHVRLRSCDRRRGHAPGVSRVGGGCGHVSAGEDGGGAAAAAALGGIAAAREGAGAPARRRGSGEGSGSGSRAGPGARLTLLSVPGELRGGGERGVPEASEGGGGGTPRRAPEREGTRGSQHLSGEVLQPNPPNVPLCPPTGLLFFFKSCLFYVECFFQ